MSTLVDEEVVKNWEPPEFTPLDENAWQAWEASCRAQDRRSNASLMRFVKSLAIAALLVEAGLWAYLTPYEVVVKFLVTFTAIVLIYKAVRARQHAYTVVFAFVAVLYNPVVPVFSFAGDAMRALVAVSTIPFLVSLFWSKTRRVEHA